MTDILRGEMISPEQEKDAEKRDVAEVPELSELPESCLAESLSFTTPKDVISLACVCRSFRQASIADNVWAKFLPPPHICDNILAQASNAPPRTCSKKELYDFLSRDRVLLHDHNGTEDFQLHRATGGVCRSLSARGLKIVWGDDPRYWRWTGSGDSRYPEVAYLKTVCWFEAGGEINWLLPPNTYTLCWRIQFGLRHAGVLLVGHHLSGWRDQAPIKLSFDTMDGQHCERKFHLCPADGIRQPGVTYYPDFVGSPNSGWMEVHVGQFTVESGKEPFGIKFSMIQTSGNWKTGVALDGVVIRPWSLDEPLVERPPITEASI